MRGSRCTCTRSKGFSLLHKSSNNSSWCNSAVGHRQWPVVHGGEETFDGPTLNYYCYCYKLYGSRKFRINRYRETSTDGSTDRRCRVHACCTRVTVRLLSSAVGAIHALFRSRTFRQQRNVKTLIRRGLVSPNHVREYQIISSGQQWLRRKAAESIEYLPAIASHRSMNRA